MAHTTRTHNLDNDSLLQLLSCYRLEGEDNWNRRLTWLKLGHVCLRWRFLIYDLSSHLNMCLILEKYSPLIDTLSHLPPLPLVIDYSDRTRTITRKDEDNIHLELHLQGRVRRVALQGSGSIFELAQVARVDGQSFSKTGGPFSLFYNR